MLTNEEIQVMEHALGIPYAWTTVMYHYKRHKKQYLKSYRNYFQTEETHKPYFKIWEKLYKEGFADKWINNNLGKDYLYYGVSDKGIEQLQKQQNYILKFV